MTAMASLRILPEFRQYVVSLVALILLWGYGHWLCQTFLVNVDMAALLGLARHYDLTTYRYGREVWEINPPLILLMLKLPIWLESISTTPAYWWATQLVMTQLWLSGLALRFGLARINAGKPAPTKASAALPAWLVIALWLGLAAGDITERDTLMAIALAPLLVAMLPVLGSVHYRMNRQEVAVHLLLWGEAGCLALLKPQYYVGLVFLMLWLALYRKDYTQNLWVCFAGVLGVGALYGGVLFYSGWMSFYLQMQESYTTVGMPWGQVRHILLWQALLGLTAGAVLWSLKSSPFKYRVSWAVLLGLSGVAALIQQKAFIYHFMPYMFLLVVLIVWAGVIAIAEVAKGRAGAIMVLFSVVGVSACLWLGASALWHKEITYRQLTPTLSSDLAQILAQYPHAPVLVLSSDMTDALSLAEMTGHPLALRMPHLWPLLELNATEGARQISPDERQQRLKKIGQMVAQDIERSYVQYGQFPIIMQRLSGPQKEQGRESDYTALFSAEAQFFALLKKYARPTTTMDRPGAGLKTMSALGAWRVYVTSKSP